MTVRISKLRGILLVDDDPEDARVIQEMLRQASLPEERLAFAADLASASSRIAEREFDIVLLDVSLPDSSGTQAVASMRRLVPNLPIVVLMGCEDDKIADEALENGAQDYLAKGQFGAPLLVRTLRHAMQRKRLDDEVKRSVSLLRATLDSTADGLVVVDDEATFVDCNRRFRELFPNVEYHGSFRARGGIVDALGTELSDPTRFRRRVEEPAGSEGEGYDLLELRDGRVYELLALPYAIEGHVAGRVWSFRDVTERQLVVEKLRQAGEAAEAANRAKTEFVSHLSHEIRTPLNSIVGASDLLTGTSLSDEQREYVTILRRSSTALLALVNDTLDFTKIEAGRLELESLPFDPAALVREVMELLKQNAIRKGLAITSDVSKVGPQRYEGDPHRLRQILVNLVGNAIKFTAEGGIHIEASSDVDGALRFVVTDTGIGIPAEKLASVFESFRQVEASITRQYGGTGLGLAISKKLVERMGGKIWVESETGRGSRFHVSVPLRALDAAPHPAPAHTTPPHTAVSTPDPSPEMAPEAAKILLADDSEDNRMLFGYYLRNTPYDLDFAEDGQKAITKFQSGTYDLVLMDLQMPVLDGNAAVRGIRDWERDQAREATPILMLTAQAEERAVEKSREAGCSGFLTKPVTKNQLLNAIHRFTQAARD
jgi:signal transduction histidine kinase/CheY-like chemotaxis protein